MPEIPNQDSQFNPPWMETPAEPPVQPSPAPPVQENEPEPTPLAVESPAGDSLPENSAVDSPFKKIIPIAGGMIIILLLFLAIKTILTKSETGLQILPKSAKKEVTLTYWGLWEPQSVMAPLIAAYQKNHPEVKINYIFQSSKDYRERLQSALAADKGPDIFRLHLTWLPMFLNQNQLFAVPDNLVDWTDYYPVMSSLKSQGKYYALPLGFDTLALYYNTELFAAAGLKPPVTWEELRLASTKLTVKDANGRIQTAGIALGTTGNVDNWSDILGLMMLQNGVDLSRPTDNLAQQALKFYTLFSRTYHVWDETLPASTYAFATGKVAMILAPSWRTFEIIEINPKLKFKTTTVPQLTEEKNLAVAWASFWVEGVAKTSANSEEAWEFLKFLSAPENLKQLYANQSQIRLFGEPYPLKSLAGQLADHPVAGAFVSQGVMAKTWYLCSRTHDNGINDRMIKYFEDAVNSVNKGGSAETALQQAATGVTQILNQYGLPTRPSSGQ